MTSNRAESSEYADPIVMVMGRQRRRNLFGARNLLALVGLIGFCLASGSLAANQDAAGWTFWRTEADERGFLIATIAMQACMTISGMIVAHTVLSQPPLSSPRVMAHRLRTYVLTLVPAALVLVLVGALSAGSVPIPRLIVAMIATYPVCVLVLSALLAPLLLRPWAWGVTFAALAVWMIASLAVGPAQAPASTGIVVGGPGGLFDASTLSLFLILGCCVWSGAAITSLGNLVDSHGPVVRGLVPPIALIGTLIFLPQMLIGASVGHIMLATALAPLVDVGFPRFVTEHDLGFGLLTVGWVAAATGSLLIDGQITALWCLVCGIGIGVPLSWACSRLLSRPRNLHDGLGRSRSSASERAHRSARAQEDDGSGEPGEETAAASGRRRFVADRGRTYWETRP